MVESNYAGIIRNNLKKLYEQGPGSPENRLPAAKDGNRLMFEAFGESCVVSPDTITLSGQEVTDPRGIIISLYALHASADPCVVTPFRAYREFADTAPYAAAFHARTEQALVPCAESIAAKVDVIRNLLNGGDPPAEAGGDFAFTVTPLPKIRLCYIFYAADEEFPASVTCLYSSNAPAFLPPDALADTGEYTSKKIIQIITG
ncbi:MAG: DUF3786 domain-containing protein [Thermodesulfobacteriota bacterium]